MAELDGSRARRGEIVRQVVVRVALLATVVAAGCLPGELIGQRGRPGLSPVPTAMPTEVERRGSRENPYALGEECICLVTSTRRGQRQLGITPLGVIRDAWPQVQLASPENEPPDPGDEYVVVSLRVVYRESDDNSEYRPNPALLQLVDEQSDRHPAEPLTPPPPNLARRLKVGETHVGNVVFALPRGLRPSLLVWNGDFREQGGVWWRLE